MLKKHTNLIPWVFVILGFLLVWSGTTRQARQTQLNREVGKTNQYYGRLVACLASESPTKRTPEYTKYCYDLVGKQTGISPDRYGDGI